MNMDRKQLDKIIANFKLTHSDGNVHECYEQCKMHCKNFKVEVDEIFSEVDKEIK